MKFLKPTIVLPRFVDLTSDILSQYGIDVLLLDVDATIAYPKTEQLLPGVYEKIDAFQRAGIRICLVSNTILPGKKIKRVNRIAKRLGVPAVCLHFFNQKPFSFGIWQAFRKLGIRRREDYRFAMMCGDQLFTDCLAGKFAGIYSCLLYDRPPGKEPWYTAWKRLPERWVLGNRLPRQPDDR